MENAGVCNFNNMIAKREKEKSTGSELENLNVWVNSQKMYLNIFKKVIKCQDYNL